MKIYIAHSKDFDYKNELYAPLRSSRLNAEHEIFLPHETDQFINTKDIIEKSDIVIAEVSFPATSEGIELGWADGFHVPILCLYKEGTNPSRSLGAVTKSVVSYVDKVDLLRKIEGLLSQGAL